MQVMRTISSKVFIILFRLLIVSLSIYFIYVASHLLTNDPEALGKYLPYKFFIWAHIAGGMTALVTGPLLIWQPNRLARIKLPRALGYCYIIGVAMGSGGAMILVFTTTLEVGWSYTTSLHALGYIWLTSALIALFAAKRKQISLHRRWMTYSYIATVAFVLQATIYETKILDSYGSFAELYPSVIWASWVIPFVVYTQWNTVSKLLGPSNR